MLSHGDLEENLAILADFSEFFASKENIEKLVKWCHEDLSLPKPIARLLINKIAPWVLSRAGNALQKLGSEGLSQLNKCFRKKFVCYRWLTSDLIVLLHTRVLKNSEAKAQLVKSRKLLEQSIFEPGKAKNILEDTELWNQLNSYQQGLVSLLSSLSGIKDLSNEIRDLVKQKQLLFLERRDAVEVKAVFSTDWLKYPQAVSTLFGRQYEIEQLKKFLFCKPFFQWWLITGPGGVGKSRLALEMMRGLPECWHWGFLNEETLKTFQFIGWSPDRPTFFVIDYAETHFQLIAELLTELSSREERVDGQFEVPVRVLLIERLAEGAKWWNVVAPKGSNEKAMRLKTLFNEGVPLSINGLTFDDQRKAFDSFSDGQIDLSGADEDFWKSIDQLSNGGLPLFIGMAVAACFTHGYNKVRLWDQECLLDFVYNHEMRIWKQKICDEKLYNNVRLLTSIATICNGISPKNINEYDGIVKLLGEIDLDGYEIRENSVMVTGNYDIKIEPDVFGEFIVLKILECKDKNFFSSGLNRLIKIINIVCEINLSSFVAFLSRCFVDFPYLNIQCDFIYAYSKDKKFHGVFLNVFKSFALMDFVVENYNRSSYLFKLITDIEPNDGNMWYYLGISYYKLGCLGKAGKACFEAAELKPNDPDMWHLSGICYYENGDFKQAIDAFDKFLEINSSESDIWLLKSHAHIKCLEYLKAEESVTKALILGCNDDIIVEFRVYLFILNNYILPYLLK